MPDLSLEKTIRDAVRTRCAEIVTEEAGAAWARVRDRLHAETDRIAVEVCRSYEFDRGADTLTILVRKPPLAAPADFASGYVD